jgi:hypothetical protein
MTFLLLFNILHASHYYKNYFKFQKNVESSCIVFPAESIKCYVCNNQLEPKCGATLELKGSEAKKYIEECEGETVACKKLESKDTYKGIIFFKNTRTMLILG